MTVPDSVRGELREKVWSLADAEHWAYLTDGDRSKLYERWASESGLGGRLAAYIGAGNARVYIKDTLLKGYIRARMDNFGPVGEALGVSSLDLTTERFIKPLGRRTRAGGVLVWDSARNWKLTLMTFHERVQHTPAATAIGAVLFTRGTIYRQASARPVVDIAFERLRLGRLVWMD